MLLWGAGKPPPVAPSHPSCRSVRVSLIIEAKNGGLRWKYHYKIGFVVHRLLTFAGRGCYMI